MSDTVFMASLVMILYLLAFVCFGQHLCSNAFCKSNNSSHVLVRIVCLYTKKDATIVENVLDYRF